MKRLISIIAALACIAGCERTEEPGNRGIGIYPGNPVEDFSPVMVQDDEYRNIALHRAAYNSSSHDYCLTAQLITDGVVSEEVPKHLTVSTPEGPCERREREWLSDEGIYTRMSVNGEDTFIQFTLGNGWKEEVDQVQMLGMVNYLEEEADGSHEISLWGSDDGQDWDCLAKISGKEFIGRAARARQHSDPDKAAAMGNRLLPTRIFEIDEKLEGRKAYPMLRIDLKMKGAQEWILADCNFLKDGKTVDLVSSRFFCSSWMSLGNGAEWVYVDLGAKASFDKIVLYWLNRPSECRILTSDDGISWKDISGLPEKAREGGTDIIDVKGKGRYVKLLMDGSVDGKPIMLSEMEVWGKGGVSAVQKDMPAASERQITLSGGNWRLRCAREVCADGAAVASQGFETEDWLVATVPGTVLSSYINIGAVPDPNHADNIFNISDSYFNSDFWYRNEFELTEGFTDGKLFLEFDGINWKADVYLNGEALGRIEGGFTRGRFDISDAARPGKNILAVRIIRNAHIGAVKEKNDKNTGVNGGILGADNPTFHASIGWDWISTIRGRNIGIWNDVRIVKEGKVSLKDPFVNVALPLPDTTSAVLSPEVYVTNNSDEAVAGTLKGFVGGIRFEQDIVLEPREERAVRFDLLSYPQLMMKDPRLWWPNGYGEPYLYDAGFEFMTGESVSDKLDFKTGIRQVDADEEGGILHLYVNGRRFIGRGGNWGFSENNLNYRGREYDIAAAYHADMNFTIMRNWVGQTGDVELYEACDRHGIMIWQDFWLANPADGPDPDDNQMFLANAEDYLRQHRSHPSLVIYCGRNEGFPPEEIDEGLRNIVQEHHPGLHYISSSADGCVSGHGPYRALPPKEYFSYPTGNDRFHSERGMPAAMTYESMLRTYSKEALWPQSKQWGQHDFSLEGAQSCATFNAMIAEGYGEPESAEEFASLAQFINYDGYRAMFESRSLNRKGLLLWMSHPAWPSMTWQTYDWYFEPTAAYFGCKKASEPVHVQWNPHSGEVEVVNYHAGNLKDLIVKAMLVNLDGSIVWENEMSIDSNEDTTVRCFALDEPESLDKTYFIKLYLTDAEGVVISDNFYVNGKEYGNHRAMQQIAKARVKTSFDFKKVENDRGIQGAEWRGTVILENRSKVPAVMVRLNVVGKKDGEQILPIFYEDNYFSLMPGERKSVSVKLFDADSRGNKPEIIVTGYNL